MFEAFCKEKLSPLALRLAVGFVCVYHGYLKIMVNGGTAWNPGMTLTWQLLIAWGEFSAGLAILLGLRCRWAAASAVAISAGTLIWWQGWNVFQLPLRTLEPIVVFTFMGLALVLLGAGELSFDARGQGGRSSDGGGFSKKRVAA